MRGMRESRGIVMSKSVTAGIDGIVAAAEMRSWHVVQ
jgi:hypothetical protein